MAQLPSSNSPQRVNSATRKPSIQGELSIEHCQSNRPCCVSAAYERSTNYLQLVCLVVVISTLGCGGSTPTDLLAAANDSNIQRVANLYEAFQSRHNWRGPKDEAEFKSFLKSWNPKKLSNIGVDPNAIDEVFISSRDKEPFKLRYKVPGNIMGSEAPVVFEATGVDGKRMVGFLNMTSREVDGEEYDRLWSGK